jgi:hypothetical protein
VLKNANDGPLGGAVEDPGAPTINAKNVDDGPLVPGGGGVSGPHPGFKRCVLNLHGYERQKVILLTGPTFPTPGRAIAYNP